MHPYDDPELDAFLTDQGISWTTGPTGFAYRSTEFFITVASHEPDEDRFNQFLLARGLVARVNPRPYGGGLWLLVLLARVSDVPDPDDDPPELPAPGDDELADPIPGLDLLRLLDELTEAGFDVEPNTIVTAMGGHSHDHGHGHGHGHCRCACHDDCHCYGPGPTWPGKGIGGSPLLTGHAGISGSPLLTGHAGISGSPLLTGHAGIGGSPLLTGHHATGAGRAAPRCCSPCGSCCAPCDWPRNPIALANPLHYAPSAGTRPVAVAGGVRPGDRNTAVSVQESEVTRRLGGSQPNVRKGDPLVVVIDTGLRTDGAGNRAANRMLRGAFFDRSNDWPTPSPKFGFKGIGDEDIADSDVGTTDAGWLDRQAGHGTFVCGIVRQYEPRARIDVAAALNSRGLGDQATLARALEDASGRRKAERMGRARGATVFSMSLGGYTRFDQPHPVVQRTMDAIRSDYVKDKRPAPVYIAAAGNASWNRQVYPAAAPGVVSVGASAWFSNYGPWVDMCAPGADVTSTFFDADKALYNKLTGWARWDGTSFATPKVSAEIVRLMLDHGLSPEDAVDNLLHSDRLRLPGLGVLINEA